LWSETEAALAAEALLLLSGMFRIVRVNELAHFDLFQYSGKYKPSPIRYRLFCLTHIEGLNLQK